MKLKFIYSEKANFRYYIGQIYSGDFAKSTVEISQNLRWIFCKILWPSQNIWTLWMKLEQIIKVDIMRREKNF